MDLGDAVREWALAWAERFGRQMLGLLWVGPLARGLEDPGGEAELKAVVTEECYRNDWASGRRETRDVHRGQIVHVTAVTLERMAGWPWDPVTRYEYHGARLLLDETGQLASFLRQHTQGDPSARRRDTLAGYGRLRSLWLGLTRQIRRRDWESALFLAPAVAAAGVQVFFLLHHVGFPPYEWLLPEFRRADPDPAWRQPVEALALARRGEEGGSGPAAALRHLAGSVVELARDAIHETYGISRGALDTAAPPAAPAAEREWMG